LRGTVHQKFFPGLLFGWHFMGVHSSTQTVGTNVGGMVAEGYRTPTRKEWKLGTKAESGTESKATVNNPSPSPWVPVRA
jgi:hypothetical protein